jgi:hypothetical protein
MQQESPRAGVLRIFRVEEGTTVHARVLSEGYQGLFTHYARGRSVYCAGEKCDSTVHKLDRVWKGYAAVELWNVATKRWNPVVLEISEALELDLRGLWKRGQVWEFWRDVPTKKKSMPIMGKLHAERDPATFPPAFDYKPVLLHLYHIQAVHLGSLNPMPPRVIVTESEGEGPDVVTSIVETERTPEQLAREEELRKKIMGNRKSPSERKSKV